MPSPPTEHGHGAISLGHMVVVCEAFERSIARRAADILEENGIPALLQSSTDGLPNIHTPPPQTSTSVFVVVPSSLEKEAIRLLRSERMRQSKSSTSRASRALQWSMRWSRPESDEVEEAVETEDSLAGNFDVDESLYLADGLPDPGPTYPRAVMALAAIAFGVGVQMVLERLVGPDVFRSTFAASTSHPEQWWRLITAGFVHFSFGHHFYNALFGAVLGIVLFGTHRVGGTMATWLIASIFGLLGQLSSPDTVLVAGASAGNYGLIGLWAKGQLERSQLSMLPKRERLRTLGVLLLLIPGALTPVSSTGSSVAVLAHVTGFVVGFLLGGVFHRRLGHDVDDELERRSRYGLYGSIGAVIVAFGFALPKLWG